MLPILDHGELKFVELQLGDSAQGRLQRLPCKAERIAGNEHPIPPVPPSAGARERANSDLAKPATILRGARLFRPGAGWRFNPFSGIWGQRTTILTDLAFRR